MVPLDPPMAWCTIKGCCLPVSRLSALFLFVCLFVCLIDWLVSWLIGWFVVVVVVVVVGKLQNFPCTFVS